MSKKVAKTDKRRDRLDNYRVSERNITIVNMLRDGYTVRQIAKEVGLSPGRITQIKNEMMTASLNKQNFDINSFANKLYNDYLLLLEDLDERIRLQEQDIDENGNQASIADPSFFRLKKDVYDSISKLFSVSSLFEKSMTEGDTDVDTVLFNFTVSKKVDNKQDQDVDSKENKTELLRDKIAREVMENIVNNGAYSDDEFNRKLENLNNKREERKSNSIDNKKNKK